VLLDAEIRDQMGVWAARQLIALTGEKPRRARHARLRGPIVAADPLPRHDPPDPQRHHLSAIAASDRHPSGGQAGHRRSGGNLL
jgi:hypothetical protein